MTKDEKLTKIKKILLEALRYEWEARDNSHTVGMMVDNWANKILKEIEDGGDLNA